MPDIDVVEIGLRIRRLREARRLSCETTAQLAGRSGRWLQDVEAGRGWKAKFRIEDANRLAEVLSVSALELLTGDTEGVNRREVIKIVATAPVLVGITGLTTLGLAFDLMGSRIDPAVVQHVRDQTFRLGQIYPVRPPHEMLPRLQSELHVVSSLIREGGAGLSDHARLLESAGWLCLLLAMTHYDLGEFVAARAARDTALALGREARSGDLVGWAFETAAWFAIYEGSDREIIEASEAGAELSPPQSSAQAMNLLKLGVGLARAGREMDALLALERAEAVASRMLPTEHADYQFAFDAPNKLDMYAARIYAFAGRRADAETRARRVVSTAMEAGASLPPTREAFGRLDLAAALLAKPLDEIDEAAVEVDRALSGPIVRYDLVERADEIVTALHARAPDYLPVKRIQERLQESRGAIGPAALPDPRSRPPRS